MVLVSYKLNSAIERGTKPDTLGRKPCHWTNTWKAAMVNASRAGKDAQTRCMTFLKCLTSVRIASTVSSLVLTKAAGKRGGQQRLGRSATLVRGGARAQTGALAIPAMGHSRIRVKRVVAHDALRLWTTAWRPSSACGGHSCGARASRCAGSAGPSVSVSRGAGPGWWHACRPVPRPARASAQPGHQPWGGPAWKRKPTRGDRPGR